MFVLYDEIATFILYFWLTHGTLNSVWHYSNFLCYYRCCEENQKAKNCLVAERKSFAAWSNIYKIRTAIINKVRPVSERVCRWACKVAGNFYHTKHYTIFELEYFFCWEISSRELIGGYPRGQYYTMYPVVFFSNFLPFFFLCIW